MRARAFPILAAILVAAAACATGGMATSGSRDVISIEDITASGAQTAYDAVQRLHPDWLSVRGAGGGGSVDVFMGGVNMGSADYLRNVLATNVREMRYYRPGEATKFGGGQERGVIELTLK